MRTTLTKMYTTQQASSYLTPRCKTQINCEMRKQDAELLGGFFYIQ